MEVTLYEIDEALEKEVRSICETDLIKAIQVQENMHVRKPSKR